MTTPRPGDPFGIRPEALPSWRTLTLRAAASPPPCSQDPEAWWSHDPTTRQQAAQACQACPLLEVCAEYADLAGERCGVWGGRPRSRRPGRPALGAAS